MGLNPPLPHFKKLIPHGVHSCLFSRHEIREKKKRINSEVVLGFFLKGTKEENMESEQRPYVKEKTEIQNEPNDTSSKIKHRVTA